MTRTGKLLRMLVLSLTIGLFAGTTFAGTAYQYGPDDEIGALNEMTPASVVAAAKLVKVGKVYDLDPGRFRGMPLWPGHPPFEVITFRTPMGEYVQKDQSWLMSHNDAHIGFISEVMICCMHTGCHMDSLAHITCGADNHWYNGFTAAEYLGDWGPLKADISTVPPVVTRGVMIDVAGYKGVNMLPAGYCITPADLQGALRKQGTALKPGDAVLVRTGQMSVWADKAAMAKGDGAGLGLQAVKWLAEKNKTILIGDDQSAFECQPSPDMTNPHPCHQYMLIQNGIHIMEFVYLEDLAKDKIYEFMFVCLPLKNKGATGSMIRPIAVN